MEKPQKKRTISEEERRECAALNAIYKAKKKSLGVTQEQIAIEGLGAKTQSAASHYLTGKNALNVEAASVFARFLQEPVAAFSPRLAKEIDSMAGALKSDGEYPLSLSSGTGKTLQAMEAVRQYGARESEKLEALGVLLDIQAAAMAGKLVDGNHRMMLKTVRNELMHGEHAKKQHSAPALSLVENSAVHQAAEVTDENYAFVTQYSAKAAAGNGHENSHVEIKGALAFKRDWLRAKRLNPSRMGVRYADGESMAPTINHGDVLLVDENSIEPVNDKVFVLRKPDGSEIVKRLIRAPDGNEWIIRSDSPNKSTYPDLQFPKEEGNEVQVIGRVVWHGGDL